jgi:hypothetical protein
VWDIQIIYKCDYLVDENSFGINVSSFLCLFYFVLIAFSDTVNFKSTGAQIFFKMVRLPSYLDKLQFGHSSSCSV